MAYEQDSDRREAWGGHTQVATQIMEEQAPSQALRDLGKQVSPTLRELFVVCDPSEALRQHFELGVSPFVLLHDLGTTAARAFLQGLSERSGWRLQTLSIRRQGFGTELASLSYLDCPLASGTLRVYLADVQADPREQVAVRRLLSALATAHVLIGATQPPPDVAARVAAWRDDLLAAQPTGRLAVLALPQVRDPDWMMSLSALARTPRWQVEVGPASQTVAANWTLMATYWNRLAQAAAPGAVPQIERLTLSWTPEAPPALRAPTPMPVVNGASVPTATQLTPAGNLAGHLSALLPQTGALRACIFALANREVWAQTAGANGAEMAEQGHVLLMSVARMGSSLALGRSVRDVHVSLGEAQVLLRATRLRSGGVLMLVLPRDADIARVRERIQQYEAQALPTRAAP
jgi:hypothetical protein